jgi:hypothetical protein
LHIRVAALFTWLTNPAGDLFIPGIDGFELSKTLRDHPATADIPIVNEGYIEFPIETSELNKE